MTIVPLVGPFHLKFPRFNSATVCDIVRAEGPEAVALTSLAPGSFKRQGWQDTPDVALPQRVVPWCRRQQLPLYPVFERPADERADKDFNRYLAQYPQMQPVLADVEQAKQKIAELLNEPLTFERVRSELVDRVRDYQETREKHLGDGPGTLWLRERIGVMAERVVALAHQRIVLLAHIDHVPMLESALSERVRLKWPREVPVTEESRRRAILDAAFVGEVKDPGHLVEQLEGIDEPEARFHEANILLAIGDLAGAKERLVALSNGDFQEPYYLPGFTLVRLGQVYDLCGERERAKRAYRGALALSWAPREAVEAARSGLEQPFSRDKHVPSS